MFETLINISATGSSGSTTVAAAPMAKRLTGAGFPAADIQVIGREGSRNFNLVARFRGPGAPGAPGAPGGPGGPGSPKPILLLSHIDVVEANREDWSVDPFTFLERDGSCSGRGT